MLHLGVLNPYNQYSSTLSAVGGFNSVGEEGLCRSVHARGVRSWSVSYSLYKQIITVALACQGKLKQQPQNS